MCEYGGETCEWSYVDNEDKKPHTVRQRVTQGYPLPNLAMIELEVAPQHVNREQSPATHGTYRLCPFFALELTRTGEYPMR